MSDNGHDLHNEFPADGDIVHRLKLGDARFQEIAHRYHLLNKQIQSAESGIAPASDARLDDLRKRRLGLLDEVAAMIASARAAA